MNFILTLLLALGLMAAPGTDRDDKAREGAFALTNARIVTVTSATRDGDPMGPPR